MYIYDRQLSGSQYRREEQHITLRPSQRTSIYVPMDSYVGELRQSPRNAPQPITLTMRPRPFLVLEGFGFDKYSLSKRHKEKIKIFASHVVKSCRTSQPIRTIRLIGHTDDIGDDNYNAKLGMRRADAVKAALEDEIEKLSPGLAKGPTKQIAIDTDTRGEKEPVTRERTKRALNRRVEVFLSTVGATPTPPPPPRPIAPKQPQIDLRKLSPETVKRLEEEARKEEEQRRLTQPVPTLPPGKSISEMLDNALKRVRPWWLRRLIKEAAVRGAWSMVDYWLNQAERSSEEKEAIRAIIRAIMQTPIR